MPRMRVTALLPGAAGEVDAVHPERVEGDQRGRAAGGERGGPARVPDVHPVGERGERRQPVGEHHDLAVEQHVGVRGGQAVQLREGDEEVGEHARLLAALAGEEHRDRAAVAGARRLAGVVVVTSDKELRERVAAATGGLTASVGLGTSKFIAKVASDLRKPDALVVVPPGTEQQLLRPMSVSVIPGVGPVTAERLRRVGVLTVGQITVLRSAPTRSKL